MLVHKTLSQIGQSSLSPSGTIPQYPTVNVQSLSLFVPLMTCYHAEFQNIEHEKIERWLVLRLVLNSIRIFRLSLLLHLVTFLIWKVLATAIVWVFHSECIKEILLEPNNYQNSTLFGPISFGLVSLTFTNFLKFALLIGHSEIPGWLYIYVVIIVVYYIHDSCLAAIPWISVDEIYYQEYTPAYLSTSRSKCNELNALTIVEFHGIVTEIDRKIDRNWYIFCKVKFLILKINNLWLAISYISGVWNIVVADADIRTVNDFCTNSASSLT